MDRVVFLEIEAFVAIAQELCNQVLPVASTEEEIPQAVLLQNQPGKDFNLLLNYYS